MKSITTLPEDFIEKVEFDRVVNLQAQETLGPGGFTLAKAPQIVYDASWIEDRLALAFDMLKSISAGEGIPLRNYEELAETFKMLEIQGYTMTLEELVQIQVLLTDLWRIDLHFQDEEKRERYPRLVHEIEKIPSAPELRKAIDKIVDKEGNIRPDASPELARIRRSMQSVQRDIDKKFRGVVQRYKERGLLTDSVESYRNGRRVLSAAVANKRKIRGIIHDLSTTGQTAYIEPEEVIGLNNDLFDLNNDERKEVVRLLKELSEQLRPELDKLRIFDRQRAHLDCLRAQAILARQWAANKPQIVQDPHVEMVEARHPLLHLKFKQEGRKVVPFTLHLKGKNQLLLLSGPNAGGKSIMLKGAGLLQIMVQAGMLVPCSEESIFGTFENFCADIGDQQSLDDDLSTYSSHLKNMKQFLENANDQTFLVIDEFGSGTDPKLGGAIAESILKEFNKKRVWGVITTHYGNLKAFVYKRTGLVNGAMVFDVDTLEPTFELRVGKPGSSYAFEVAGKAGLDSKLLSYAKTRVRGNEHEVDKLLLDLEREKTRAKETADSLDREKANLDKLAKTYARMQRDLEIQRKTFKLETQERALQAEARQQKELEKMVRELREAERADEAKKVVQERKQTRKKREEIVADLKEELNAVSAKSTATVLNRPIQLGDSVRLKRGGSTGEIVKLDKNKALVQMGELSISVQIKDLELVRKPVEIIRKKRITQNLQKQEGTFKTEIDVRGFRREEVLQLVQDFIDKGMINNAKSLRILHGKGNGTLRRTVKEKLREYSNIDCFHPAPKQGGDGVTIVEF